MTEITIGKSGGNFGWIFLLVVGIAITGSGYYLAWQSNRQLKKLRTELIKSEFDKFPIINDKVDSIKLDKTLTIENILEYERQIKKLKDRIQQNGSDEIDLEEALKIIRDEE